MVTENPPNDFDKTAGNFERITQLKSFLSRSEEQRMEIGRRLLKSWDDDYLKKSKTWEYFVKTTPLYLNIENPTRILESDFNNIFGRLPITQNPNILTKNEFIELGKLAGLDFKLGEKKKGSR